MKKFETPVVELVKFEVMDVVTTSGTDCADNSTLPDDEF